jgi:tRNA pseudouridine55 synthase
LNLIFVADKPTGCSCAQFLGRLKRKYSMKKAGYSGTLDVFASGALIVAFGQYTKLFRYLDKTPKRYEACLYLGAHSETLDIEGLEAVDEVAPMSIDEVRAAAASLTGSVTYTPPKFSAKKIDGRRAYDLARKGQEVELKPITTEVYALEILRYEHPYIYFAAEVSEGGYIRSLGALLAERLGCAGCLKELRREREGQFVYDDEKPLDVTKALRLTQNFYLGDTNDVTLGRKLAREDFELQDEGEYFMVVDGFLAVVSIADEVKYILNRIEIC